MAAEKEPKVIAILHEGFGEDLAQDPQQIGPKGFSGLAANAGRIIGKQEDEIEVCVFFQEPAYGFCIPLGVLQRLQKMVLVDTYDDRPITRHLLRGVRSGELKRNRALSSRFAPCY